MRTRARVPRAGRPVRRRTTCRDLSGSSARSSHDGHSSSPFRHARSSTSVRAARTCTSRTSAASAAFASGTMTDRVPRRASASTSASVPGTARTEPSRPSSPSTATASSTPAGSSSAAARSPSATASSSPEPDLRTPPGARLTVMRCIGKPRSDESSAARTRSRDSRTAVSGSPTTWYAGRPDDTWTSTVTGCPSTPTSVALRTAASTATSSTTWPLGRIHIGGSCCEPRAGV